MTEIVIPIINGPNLNLVGRRETEIYGTDNFDTFIYELRERFSGLSIPYHQSNHEGDIIDLLHYYGFSAKAIVLNPGGYTHTSIAISDAIRAIESPVLEIHLTNIYEREPYRRHSYMKEHCIHSICGQGMAGYEIAIQWLLNNL